MKQRILLAALAALLMLSVPSVPAIALPYQYRHSTVTSSARDLVLLTRRQRRIAWRQLHREVRSQYGPPGFAAIIGWGVPPAVALEPIPARTADAVPALKPYDFAVVRERLLIVNPRDMIVAAVIRAPATMIA